MPGFDESDQGMTAALAAIDATLAGHPVDPEHAELAELALILSDDRPYPSQEFASALDDRFARRFARRPVGDEREARPRRRWSWRSWPTLATAAVGLVAVVGGLAASGTFSTGPSKPFTAFSKAPGSAKPTTRSSASSASAASNAVASSSTASTAAGPLAPASGAPPSLLSPAKRQVVQSAQLQLAAAPARIENVAQQVFDVIGAEKGVVNSSNVTATGNANGYASFQLTVPNANLSPTMTALSQLHGARVVSRSDASSDITGQVGGAGEKLAQARAVRRSLLKQLAAASTAQQVSSIKAQLRDADASIASDLSTLNGLHRQVDDSRIQVTIQAAPPAAKGSSGGSFTIRRALHDAGRVLVVTAGVALIVLAALVPVALIAALLAWVGSLVRRRRRDHALDLL